MLTRSTRRDFVKRGLVLTGAATAVSAWPAPFVLADPSPATKLGVAVIGGGGMGGYSVGCALSENASSPWSTWTTTPSPRS